MLRDVVVLIAGAVLLFGQRQARVEVRYIGKVATMSLMTAVPAISWGNLGYPLADAALVVGWLAFVPGIVEYYVAAAIYLGDARRIRVAP